MNDIGLTRSTRRMVDHQRFEADNARIKEMIWAAHKTGIQFASITTVSFASIKKALNDAGF